MPRDLEESMKTLVKGRMAAGADNTFQLNGGYVKIVFYFTCFYRTLDDVPGNPMATFETPQSLRQWLAAVLPATHEAKGWLAATLEQEKANGVE